MKPSPPTKKKLIYTYLYIYVYILICVYIYIKCTDALAMHIVTLYGEKCRDAIEDISRGKTTVFLEMKPFHNSV